jgi:hypothetical protein
MTTLIHRGFAPGRKRRRGRRTGILAKRNTPQKAHKFKRFQVALAEGREKSNGEWLRSPF